MHDPVGPGDQSGHDQGGIGVRRVQQHRGGRYVGLDPSAEEQPVGARQVIVEDDGIRTCPVEQRIHLLAVGGNAYTHEPRAGGDRGLEADPDGCVIVDHGNPDRAAGPAGGRAAHERRLQLPTRGRAGLRGYTRSGSPTRAPLAMRSLLYMQPVDPRNPCGGDTAAHDLSRALRRVPRQPGRHRYWTAAPDAMHDRIRLEGDGARWHLTRLAP